MLYAELVVKGFYNFEEGDVPGCYLRLLYWQVLQGRGRILIFTALEGWCHRIAEQARTAMQIQPQPRSSALGTFNLTIHFK